MRILNQLVPWADASALLGAVAITGFHMLAVGYAAAVFLLLAADESCRSRLNPRVSDDTGRLFARVALPLVVLLPFVGFDSNARMLAVASSALALVVMGRLTVYALGRRAKARDLIFDRALIVGTEGVSLQVADVLEGHPEFGLRPVGFIGRAGERDLPLPILGDDDDLLRVVHEFKIDRLIVASGPQDDQSVIRALRSSQSLPLHIHIVPRLHELGGIRGHTVDDLWGIPLVHVPRPNANWAAWAAKRAFDLTAASLALVLASPVLLLSAVAVRLSSPGPILFRQTRVGREGRLFQIMKFRTMREHHDCDTAWFESEDERVTPVGRLLRRLSIDELPQLVNVIRGEMALVGPRPERPHFVDRFKNDVRGYNDRHRVAGGITGWAQIHGRSRGLDAIPERARFDNHYIDNWSLWRDLVILLRTVPLAFRGDSQPNDTRQAPARPVERRVGSAGRLRRAAARHQRLVDPTGTELANEPAQILAHPPSARVSAELE